MTVWPGAGGGREIRAVCPVHVRFADLRVFGFR